MLFFSDFLFTQVRIKEKVVINPQQSLKNNNIIAGDTTSKLQILDTTGTVVTVTYYYRACDNGFGVVRTTQSPCNAYMDSAVGNKVTSVSQQGIARFQFKAYDAGTWTFLTDPRFVCPNVLCGLYTCNDSIVVTDNRGTRVKGTGSRPTAVYQAQVGTTCVITNPQPQQLDLNSIERYKEGYYFSPEIGSPPIIVTGCNLRRSPGRQGVTYVMPGLPQGNNYGGYTWTPQDAISLDLCLDINQNVWRIKVNNLRIPIFASSCISGYTDLGDGCDPNILSMYIKSKSEYEILLDDIEWWKIGPYSQIGSAPKKYAFSSGIESHEDAHLAVTVISLPKYFNAAFDSIYNRKFPKSLYPCAKNAKDAGDFITRNDIRNAVEKAHNRSKDMSPFDNLKEDLDADDFASIEYKLIRMCVEDWAKMQPWYR